MTTNNNDEKNIRETHAAAVRAGEEYYFDPKTGFLVMTELHHLARGECCDNKCRHCPFRSR